MEQKKFKIVESKKTRYILPNILTIAGVCLGISSIKFSLDLNFSLAVIFITLAAILDALDAFKLEEKDKVISQDEHKKKSSDVQKITDNFIKKIDEIVTTKKNEIIKV